MADISDADLRGELKALTGKDAGPVTPSTRPLLINKLQKLKKGSIVPPGEKTTASEPPNKKTPSSSRPSQTRPPPKASNRVKHHHSSLGFSSDDDQEAKSVSRTESTASSVNKTKRKSVVSNNNSSSRARRSIPAAAQSGATPDFRSYKPKEVNRLQDGISSAVTEKELLLLDNGEIQTRLYELTGTRFPVTESTKHLFVQRLHKVLSSGDASSNSSQRPGLATTTNSQYDDTLPMETQFSDSDDDIMEYESSPDMKVAINTSASIVRPEMVNQSVNTSSLLDFTLPDPPDDDPDCFITPPIPGKPDGDDHNISSTSRVVSSEFLSDLPPKLPSPNLSSTRRSFLPPSTVSSPTYRKPVPPSPPRSTYARRPLTTKTQYIGFKPNVTPKPTSRFSSSIDQSNPPARSSAPDQLTGYNTGSGKVIDAFPSKRAKAAKDMDMMIRDRGKNTSYLYSRALVIGLGVFLALLSMLYLYLRMTAPEPLGKWPVFFLIYNSLSYEF